MSTCENVTNALPAGLYTTWPVAMIQSLPESL